MKKVLNLDSVRRSTRAILSVVLLYVISVKSQPLTVTWRGNDITGIPTLIYHDEVTAINYTVPALRDPNGPGGLLCNSTVGPIAWWPGNGRTELFDTNMLGKQIYQIIPSGNLTAQIVRDGRSNELDLSKYPFHNGLFTCRRNGDISTAIPVGFYYRHGSRVHGVITRLVVSIISSSFNATPPSFTLAGDTEGGPPETYTWTRNGAPITNNVSFSISIRVNGVTDPSAYENSRYRSTLTVTGRLPGVYQYSVSNRATTDTLTSNITIGKANYPVTIFWQGNDITNKPTLIYHDEVETVMYSPPPTLSNPNGPHSLLCNSTVGPIAWHPGDGRMQPFDTNRSDRQIYQIITNGSLTAQIVNDGRTGRSNEVNLTGRTYHNGLFTCRWNGDISTAVPVGFYYRRGVTVHDGVITRPVVDITSSSFIAASPSFTLAGDTEGGPPETYTWTRNGAPITNNDSFSISIGVNGATDKNAYVNSRYRSTLTVTGTLPGMYQYSVSNRATNNTLTSNINIEGAAPTNLMTEQNGINSVLVSWTPPSPPPIMGYQITVDSTDLSAGINVINSSATISLQPGVRNIRMRTLSQHYPSEIVGPVNITVKDFLMPTVTSSLLTNTSANISWSQPEGSLVADYYNVSIQRSDQQFCLMSLDKRTMNINATSVNISNLFGSSTYSVMITAKAYNNSRTSTSDFSTPLAAPTGSPQAIDYMVTARSVNVSWNEIECIERNGMITNYTVVFSSSGGSVISGVLMVNERRFTASELTPFTNYTFQVAGINGNGTGPLSNVTIIQTAEDTPGPVLNLSNQTKYTFINLTWAHPANPNGIILGYEIAYTVNGSAPFAVNETRTTMYTIPHLTPQTRVFVSVRAYTSVGPGEPSNPINLTTLSLYGLPSMVMNIKVENINGTSVRVSWDGVNITEITSYMVYYSIDGQLGGQMNITVPKNETSVVIGSLMIYNLYHFQVVAIVEERGKLIMGQRSMEISVIPTETPGSDSSAAVIAGGIIAAIAVMAIIVVIILLVLWSQRKHRAPVKKSDVDTIRYGVPLLNNKRPSDSDSEPLIEEFPEDIKAIEGRGVFFKVVVSGKPVPSIAWFHDESEIMSDYSVEIKGDGTLSIPSVEKKHEGIYKMVAKNSVGSVEQQVKLHVTMEGEETADGRKIIEFSPIPMAEFGDYVVLNHNNQNQGFRDIFQALESGDKYSKSVGLSPEYKKLNRFANITVYDHNRILLNPISGHDDCKGEFVNACYIDGYLIQKKFIATQGPIPKTLVDFWRLIWQEKPPTIVMVTNLEEGSKKKCEQYWPETGSTNYGPFKVTITESQKFADYCIRTLQVALEGSNCPHKLRQFHFTAWPDHGVPDYASPMLGFYGRICSSHNPQRGPILVHCSAGVGRTGTFICIDYVLEQIKKENVVDIAGAINKMRHQRMKMVQTPEQLIFLHDAILESVTCGNTQITAADLRMVIGKCGKVDPSTGVTHFQSQFNILEKVSPKASEVLCTEARKYPDRNRRSDYLPSDRYRVILNDHPNYVHAVFAPGYKQQKAFIIAEGPMASTARNMLKILYDRKCGAVVMLSDLVENGEETSIKYWPASGQVGQFGEYTVDLISEEILGGFTIRTLSILEKKSKVAHRVTQFHITCWDPSGQCSNLKSVVDTVDEVEKIQRRTGNKPILIHCSDTVTRSGMFCAIATIIDRCKIEGVVDVFQVVKALRVQKPGAVPTLANYQMIFDATLTFLDSFDTYANFQNM